MVASAEHTPVFNVIARWRERAIYALLFLFPIFGVSLGHWFSGIFSIIVLISLTCLFNKTQYRIYPEERWMLYLLAAYFATFILSALLNGWGESQTRSLGVEIRYLAVIPVYFMLRCFPQAGRYLLAGGILAALVLAAHAYCDLYVFDKARAWGRYSPNLFGSFAALIAAWLLIEWRFHPVSKSYLLPFCGAALFAVALSGSRGAYLGLFVMIFFVAMVSLSHWRRYVAIVLVLSGLALTYIVVDGVKERVDLAVQETGEYFSGEEGGRYEQRLSGTAVRFEMWRFVGKVFVSEPILGIGRGNYSAVADEYIKDGKIHPDVGEHGHPHNAYTEALISRGIIGISFFLLMLLYPLYYFYHTRQLSPHTALLGMAHILGFMVFSLTDASTFIKGNFASIFLLYLVVFFSWHVRKIREVKVQ